MPHDQLIAMMNIGGLVCNVLGSLIAVWNARNWMAEEYPKPLTAEILWKSFSLIAAGSFVQIFAIVLSLLKPL